MCSAVFILDAKGKVLISRTYRGDVSGNSVIEQFLPLLLDEEVGAACPVVRSGDTNFLYIRHNNLFLVATTRLNSSAASALLFLQRLRDVFIEYFKELQEESIRDNFVIIYELLDEMMDFGYVYCLFSH